MEHITTDFYLSCYLTHSGLKIKEIRRNNPRKLEFVFEDSPSLNELKRKYFWHEAKVNPIQFKEHIKMLKDMMYN